MFLRLFFLLLILPTFSLAQDSEPLPPDQAFPFKASVKDSKNIIAQWDLPEGYYLYHSKFKFRSDTPGITLGEPIIPAGKKKTDPFFGPVETHRHRIDIEIPVNRSEGSGNSLKLIAKSQGCADLGICYPPYEQTAILSLPPISTAQSSEAAPVKALQSLGQSLGLQSGPEEFLEPDQAFHFNAQITPDNTISAIWQIADDYYLYRDKLKYSIKDGPVGARLGEVELPKGKLKNDEFFGEIEVYHYNLEARIPILGVTAGDQVKVEFSYQGCAEAGLCYPPQFKTVVFKVPQTIAAVGDESTSVAAPDGDDEPVTEQDKLVKLLYGGNTLAIIALFFLAGLGLAFTPCVFPMVPILSGIIAGQGQNITTRKAFILSLVYVLSVAVAYTIAGIIAGKYGANLQTELQNPWVLSITAGIFVMLSLSMFGFYELQLPSSLQSRLTEISNRQQGGTLTGVAIMGLLSALIVGPCVAAPLAGALIFIGQEGSAVLGGLALFSLSMGMGAPLLVLGTGGGKLLPRAGVWMDSIKAVFGVVMLGVAVWLLERVLPAALVLLLWGILLIIPAVYLGALEPLKAEASGWQKFRKGSGLLMLVYGVLLVLGAGMGSSDPFQPLQDLRPNVVLSSGVAGGGTASEHGMNFKRVKSVQDLEREVQNANRQGKTALLDFYADWCISCKEFEKYTFSDPVVQTMLNNTVALQADVTANDDVDKALIKHFGLIGPPTILFFDNAGKELSKYRVVGYMNSEQFTKHLGLFLPKGN